MTVRLALGGIVMLATLVAGLSATGCGGDGTGGSGGGGGAGGGPDPQQRLDYCTKKAQCDGGNDKDVKACVASYAGARNEAAAYGCEAQYDVLTDCIWTNSTCKDMIYGAECSDQQLAVNKCEADAAGMK
ncbi:MAG: hypothetical protein U0359_33260 [Byssovorax sp.]